MVAFATIATTNFEPWSGHTKLMFRITDFSGHFLGGEGGIKIKIKLTECTKYAESESK